MSTAKRSWLVKSEPDVYSIDDLKRDKRTIWDGVRNYQARNFLQEMAPGELVLFYHSSTEPAGIAGIATVAERAAADPTQFDPQSDYYDPKATPEAPRWFCPTLRFKKKLKRLLPLSELRSLPELKNMMLLKRGSRLSVQPVTEQELNAILEAAAERL